MHPYRLRNLELYLCQSLEDSPVVVINGPRQCGKTTLVQEILCRSKGYDYISLDDDAQRKIANEDPVGFVASLPEKVVLDEAQRAPGIFLPIKMVVDADRRPGRFVLTGSANILQTPAIGDSLAGRIAWVYMQPMAQSEIEGTQSSLLDRLFANDFGAIQQPPLSSLQIAERMVSGGYPVPALHLTAEVRRSRWYKDYITALMQRDAPDLFGTRKPGKLTQIMELAAAASSQLLNISGLAKKAQINRISAENYIGLLQKMFLVEQIRPWHKNWSKRLVKTPKLHIKDTGLACALRGLDSGSLVDDRSLFGQLLETFVLQELKRQPDEQLGFYYYRERNGAEVDIVIEHQSRGAIGLEVKASSTVKLGDFKPLQKLKQLAGQQFIAGAILYTGGSVVCYDNNLYAIPLDYLWRDPK